MYVIESVVDSLEKVSGVCTLRRDVVNKGFINSTSEGVVPREFQVSVDGHVGGTCQ